MEDCFTGQPPGNVISIPAAPDVHEGRTCAGSYVQLWISAFIWKGHDVENRRFQPTFSHGIPQPFLAHADSKYAKFRPMDHALICFFPLRLFAAAPNPA